MGHYYLFIDCREVVKKQSEFTISYADATINAIERVSRFWQRQLSPWLCDFGANTGLTDIADGRIGWSGGD
jgi:hypothetical protein